MTSIFWAFYWTVAIITFFALEQKCKTQAKELYTKHPIVVAFGCSLLTFLWPIYLTYRVIKKIVD